MLLVEHMKIEIQTSFVLPLLGLCVLWHTKWWHLTRKFTGKDDLIPKVRTVTAPSIRVQ
jgi:hypothetical protein